MQCEGKASSRYIQTQQPDCLPIEGLAGDTALKGGSHLSFVGSAKEESALPIKLSVQPVNPPGIARTNGCLLAVAQ
jgi:hypothetical protein